MNTQEIQGQWNKIRGKVKEKWGQLTDDDLQISNGNVDLVVGRIQQKTGEARDKIERFLGELTSKGSAAASNMAESVGGMMQDAGEHMREQYDEVSQRVQRGYEQTKDMVRTNPGQSLATAFGVGAVLGLIVGLALRSR
jgi:uncharacterized protein YjbJ (UPF0337 family)